MKRGDIFLVNLPQVTDGAGHEQVGTRPALIMHDDATSGTLSVVIIVPFTSNLKAKRFPHTIVVQPSKENGLSMPSVLRCLSIARNRQTTRDKKDRPS